MVRLMVLSMLLALAASRVIAPFLSPLRVCDITWRAASALKGVVEIRDQKGAVPLCHPALDAKSISVKQSGNATIVTGPAPGKAPSEAAVRGVLPCLGDGPFGNVLHDDVWAWRAGAVYAIAEVRGISGLGVVSCRNGDRSRQD